MGTTYEDHAELPLSELGLEWFRVKILNAERTYGSFHNPPAPQFDGGGWPGRTKCLQQM